MTTKAFYGFQFLGSVGGSLCDDSIVTWSAKFTPDSGYSNNPPTWTPMGRHVLVTPPLLENSTEYGAVSPGTLTLTPIASIPGGTPQQLAPLTLRIAFVGGGMAGETWIERTNSGQRNWTTLACSGTGEIIFAAVENGDYLYRSTDSGATWSALLSQANWSCLTCSDNGSIVVAGNYGNYLHISSNGGANWTGYTGLGTHSWSGLACSKDGSILVACALNGSIFRSTDSGATWEEVSGTGPRSWSSVACSGAGEFMVATTVSGQIYTSTDSGATWQQRSVVSKQWRGVACSESGEFVVAVAYGDYAYISNNYGAVWDKCINSRLTSYTDVACSDNGLSIVAVALGDGVHTSHDGGSSWEVPTGAGTVFGDCVAVACSNDASKIVVADYGRYLFTSDA